MSDPVKTPKKPTLDDLFALKRAERPDESFWNEFERGLRQKQLAAIVLPRPWWHAPSLWARKAAPYGGFAAAAAALALAFTTLRTPVAEHSHSISARPSSNSQVALVPAAQDLTPAQQSFASPVAVVATANEEVVPAALAGLTAQSLATKAVATDNPTVSTPVASVPNVPAPDVAQSQAVAVSGLGEPGFVAERVVADASVLPLSPSLADAPLPVPQAEEIVVQPIADLNSRHGRLLAKTLEETPGEEDRSLAQVRERVVHRLADGEELYASITRVGLSGDRLSLKF